ncbi:MAG: 50S ribosomal protein L17, partial [Aquificae bacterium]|nr:50S ribosomal protein L17 [Aquificota bacterium]
GGYTRIYKLDKRRRGDDAQMAIIEFVAHPDREEQ